MVWNIRWQSGKDLAVKTVAEIEKVLDALQQESGDDAGILVEVTSANKDSLAIGLSKKVGVLSFARGTGKPCYLSSTGDDPSEEAMVFRYMGEWTEVPKRKTLPIEKAREAVRYFLATGMLSPDVDWEED